MSKLTIFKSSWVEDAVNSGNPCDITVAEYILREPTIWKGTTFSTVVKMSLTNGPKFIKYMSNANANNNNNNNELIICCAMTLT